MIVDATADGEQVLCFSEFTSHLDLVGGELREEHGVEHALFAGPTPKAEREALERRFRSGKLGCVGPARQGRRSRQPSQGTSELNHIPITTLTAMKPSSPR